MDTSETYIKMCACEEIQKLYNPDEPNFLWDYTLRTSFGDKKFKELRHTIVGWQLFFDCLDGYKWSCIWLPRQDQLQAMVINDCTDIEEYWPDWTWNMLKEFMSFVSGLVNWGNTPMEQLWLAFVMKEKYGKVWDGEEWV